MRVSINAEMMDRCGYYISKSKANEYSQDVWLTTETPIMSVKNNKKLGIKNGMQHSIKSIQKGKIVVGDIFHRFENEFTDAAFAEYFVVCYAMTNHKVQGITIKKEFNIYEWIKMIKRERYTAYSRTSNGENVKIVNDYQVNEKLWAELKDFFSLNYCIYKWTSTACNDLYVGHTKNFEKRQAEHLKDAQTKDNNLYVKMRATGLDTWKMEILEEFYAKDRLDAEKVEQTWIDQINPNLNMTGAYKV